MKISQAVLLLASSSSAEKVVVDRTVQLHLPVSEDGVRSGKETYTVKTDSKPSVQDFKFP